MDKQDLKQILGAALIGSSLSSIIILIVLKILKLW